MRLRIQIALVFLAVTLTSVARGDPSPRTHPIPMVLTVSGGVSLGAYQAGYLFYLTEVAKMNPQYLNIRLVTGASAGMINTLLTLLSMGDDLEQDPSKSLFFNVWTSMRYDELLDVATAPPMALSSRTVLNKLANKIAAKWHQGLHERLDMVLGATATRLETYEIKITDGFSVPRQEEKFVFRVRGQGKGRPPAVMNYVDRTYGSEQPLLPFVDESKKSHSGKHYNFEIIRKILFASSAIPIVFPPQEIDFCLTDPTVETDLSADAFRDCPVPKYTKAFVDGSLADRRPLRLAHRIARSGLRKTETGAVIWLDRPSREQHQEALLDDLYFFYIDPTRPSYPQLHTEEEGDATVEQATRFFPSLGVFMRGYLTSARAKEVATLVDEHPDVRDRIRLVDHDFPTVSSQLGKFFGFFDREFRIFDFYLGMRDARRFVASNLETLVSRKFQQGDLRLSYPDPVLDPTAADISVAWRPYLCLRSQLDGLDQYAGTCGFEGMRNHRILLQIALDRLYDHCRQLPYDETIDHLHCKRAMSGKPPPRIYGMADNPNWQRDIAGNERSFEYTMRLLETYNFHFRDLGLGRDDAPLAMSRIRSELQLYVDAFAKKLPFGERVAVRVLGKPAVNFFMYAPPEAIVYIVAGTGAEMAASLTLGHSSLFRYNFALQVQGFYLLLSENPNILALTPLAGIEAEIYPLSSALLQTRIGLRIGYQFSTNDRFLANPCDTAGFGGDSLICSAPVAQLFAALSFYERIRLQGGVEWFPRWLPPMKSFGEDVWNGFIEVGWQWISPF
ncbi:MAG: patatin-like phospholipase family protein [Myxococcota bacterium]|nr:patatin-like phospholipase family protein [Myxococcota bacterium]